MFLYLNSRKTIVKRSVTYSPSFTIPLTRACINHCLYCSYRKDGDGLLSMSAIKRIARKAHQEKAPEILILSGERPDEIPRVQRDLDLLGEDSFISWTVRVCKYLLDEYLIPHVNIGTLDAISLERLRDVTASMGLMIEGVNPDINARIHPGKDLGKRFQTLEWAGKLKIPFTTGILIGTGENQKDRLDSILALERIQRKYGNIQEIILQKYVANGRSRLRQRTISLDDIKEIVDFCKSRLPGVSIQIPPNLDRDWAKFIAMGVNDLGGVSSGKDFVNPRNPWPKIEVIAKEIDKAGAALKKRLPIYPNFYELGWYSDRVRRVLLHWIKENDEYAYYSKRGVTRKRSLT